MNRTFFDFIHARVVSKRPNYPTPWFVYLTWPWTVQLAFRSVKPTVIHL